MLVVATEARILPDNVQIPGKRVDTPGMGVGRGVRLFWGQAHATFDSEHPSDAAS